jgi:hypothetical protein
MDPVIKGKWTARLRDPSLQQGVGNLKRRDINGEVFHCCLGVLCDIAVEEGVNIAVTDHGNNSVILFDGNEDFLPTRVASWAGLTHNPVTSEWLDGVNMNVTLSYLNDNGGRTFPEIADIIDRDL